MRQRPVLLALLVAVLTAAAVWLLDTGEPEVQRPHSEPEAATPDARPGETSAEQGALEPRREEAPPEAAPEDPPPQPAAAAPTVGLRGVVKELGGGGLANIRLELVLADGQVLETTTSRERGGFEFERLPPPKASIVTQPDAGVGPRLRHRIPRSARPGPSGRPRGGTPRIVLWRPASGSLEGTVIDAAGRPVAGASITTDRPLSLLSASPWQVLEGPEPDIMLFTKTDARGRFSLRGQRQGSHRLVASHGDEQASGSYEVGTSGIVLQLGVHANGDVVLAGQITQRNTGVPVAGAKVSVHRVSKTTGGSSSVWVGGATSGSGGRYEVQGLEAGHYQVAVRADGYASTSHEDRDFGVGGHTVDFVVDPARRVQVRVLRPDGEPAKGVKLRALDPSGSRLRTETRFGAMTEISVNDRGEATLRGLPATTVQLLAVRGDFHPAGRALLDLTPEETEPVTITMPTIGSSFARRHYFTLLDEAGEPIEVTGTLVARAFDGETLVSRVEGHLRDGKHYLGHDQRHGFDRPMLAVGAPEGPCRVELEVPGYRTEELTLEPGAESPTPVRLRR